MCFEIQLAESDSGLSGHTELEAAYQARKVRQKLPNKLTHQALAQALLFNFIEKAIWRRRWDSNPWYPFKGTLI